MKREEFKIKSNNRFKSDNYGSSHMSLKGSGLQGEQNHERQSFVRINGQVQVTKDERTLKMKGWLSWSIVFNNYRLHFLIILSAVFSALS